ncbi:2-methylaconitate cis-trans isomerase PrpF [Vibrio ostreicida]|uniref:2-methylaconitate cis-trans isomerase PrpF n=1 Tax=Vibrio ostreicida TaxID=526588 RepID=UPI003B5CEDBE
MKNGLLNQTKIRATFMRGGTSKGVFFALSDLPERAQTPGEFRDKLLMRIIGSPDPYEKQIDGMGGATSSTSKVVIVSKSARPDHDVDYLFGQVAIEQPVIDWSGNCGNLSAAIGPIALELGLIEKERIPEQGIIAVRVWQANIQKTIVVHVPITDGAVQEMGDFELDGVTFPAAELLVDFIQPAASDGNMFPTGNVVDTLDVPEIGSFTATCINAGIPTIFLHAQSLGYIGTELQDDINSDELALKRFEAIRTFGALKMGLSETIEEAEKRQHTPKIAFVSESKSYQSSSGKYIADTQVDLVVRALSMGKLHHAMMGTAAVAIACASCVDGTLVNRALGGGNIESVTFGHPSGVLKVGAQVHKTQNGWVAKKAVMRRSARILMEGYVRIPSALLEY